MLPGLLSKLERAVIRTEQTAEEGDFSKAEHVLAILKGKNEWPQENESYLLRWPVVLSPGRTQ